jgi:hypothetical protein
MNCMKKFTVADTAQETIYLAAQIMAEEIKTSHIRRDTNSSSLYSSCKNVLVWGRKE